MDRDATQREIEEILLEFAYLRDEVTTSDFQGIAMAEAKRIFNLVKETEQPDQD